MYFVLESQVGIAYTGKYDRSPLEQGWTYVDRTLAIYELWVHRSVVHVGTTGSAEKDLDRVRAEPIFLYQVD